MSLPKSCLLALCISFSLFACSQDISGYLDDGGFSNGRVLVKAGIDPLCGTIPVFIEHYLNKRMSLEWEAGLVSLKRQTWLYAWDPLPIDASGTGFTASGALKLYLKTFPERHYFALRSGITRMSGMTFTDALSMNFGYQRPIIGKWMIDVEVGFGVRVFKDSTTIGEVTYTEKDSRILLPVSLKTGYMF